MNRKKIVLLTVVLLLVFSFSHTAFASPFFERNYKQINTNPVTILMYHMFSENPEEWSTYCTSPQVLENDIIYLKNQGYEFLTANELATEYIPNPYKKVVLLTLDDGYESDYQYVLPLLEKYGVKATFFVTGSHIGLDRYLTKEMLLSLSQSPYAEIGNHSYLNHSNSYEKIQEMLETQPEIYAKDFLTNRAFLESIIKKPVTSLSYPNGLYNRSVNAMVLMQGHRITLSTDLQRFVYGAGDIPFGRINRPHNAEISELMKIQFHD